MLIRKEHRTHTEGPPRRKLYSPSGRLIEKYHNNSSVTQSASGDMDYGELYINQRFSCYNERSAFTGKERDSETGYGYFGARYMDHELLTMWLSIDPMADKYPGISPYAYCAWNPIKLVDPDGREIDDYFTKNGQYLGSDNATTNNVRIIRSDLWNSLEKDENGKVDHELANIISTSFSEASSGMPTDGQLNVYQHYNPTGYAIEDTPSSETPSNNPGMITKVGCKGNDNSIIKHLYVRLKNNRTPNRNGDALCDNADEIVNAYIHENDHIEKALKMGYKKWYELNQTNEGKRAVEISAIAAQRAHSSWSGCRDSFKKGVERYEKQF